MGVVEEGVVRKRCGERKTSLTKLLANTSSFSHLATAFEQTLPYLQ